MSESARGRIIYVAVICCILLSIGVVVPRTEAAIGDVTEDTCRGCHTTATTNHHNLATSKGYSCSLCHKPISSPGGGYTMLNFRNCLLCHTPAVHRMSCTLCHPEMQFADYVGHGVEMHNLHRDKVVCGVCHKIPKTLSLGPPNAACGNLCHAPKPIGSGKEMHSVHSLSFGIESQRCYWCHGLSVIRPLNPCNLCHTGLSSTAKNAHKLHARQLECSVCHASVGGFSDVRTSSRNIVCSRCHEPRGGCNITVHFVHVLDKGQCYACHGSSDVYATSRGRLDCSICHDTTLNPKRQAAFDEVHRKHAARGMTCAGCHQIPPSANGVTW